MRLSGRVLGCALAVASFCSFAGTSYKGFERGDALITAQELKTMLDNKDPKLVVIAVADTVDYRTGHIPGSFQVWRPDYEAKEGQDYPYGGMVAKSDDFQTFARNLGVDDDSHVVVYDYKYDATRLWWSFYLYGKKDVRVLDGGYGAWQAAGYDSEILAPDAPAAGNFTAKATVDGWSVDSAYVKAGQKTNRIQLWDTRETKEWTGEELKKGAFRKGRIPQAQFLNWKEFRDADGAFLDAQAMTAMLEKQGMDNGKDQVFYCQSGVRTTQEIFGLYLLGWSTEKLHNFDGSWIAWSYEKENPLVCEKCDAPAVALKEEAAQ